MKTLNTKTINSVLFKQEYGSSPVFFFFFYCVEFLISFCLYSAVITRFFFSSQLPNSHWTPAFNHPTTSAPLSAPTLPHAARAPAGGRIRYAHGGQVAPGLLPAQLPPHRTWLSDLPGHAHWQQRPLYLSELRRCGSLWV